MKFDFKNKSELFKIHFMLMKIAYVLSALMLVQLAFEGFNWLIAATVMSGLMMLTLQFFLLIKAEKLLAEKNYLGFLIAIGLTLLYLPSLFFPLSLFGLYTLLNKEFRQAQMEDIPVWMNDCFVKLDSLTAKKC
jgi:hypothetical protein